VAHRATLIVIQSALNQTPAYTSRLRAAALHSVLVYSPAFAGSYRVYPLEDVQADLTRVDGYIWSWFTHPQTVTPSQY